MTPLARVLPVPIQEIASPADAGRVDATSLIVARRARRARR
jgi:hypothetical protein